MTPNRLFTTTLAALAGTWGTIVSAQAAAPLPPVTSPASTAQPTTSPFDAVDPEIRAIKRLNWREADFDKLDLQTRGAALVALNQMLDAVGAKAEARAELLVDYLDKNNLGAAYASDAAAAEEPKGIAFDDAKKIGAAFIQSPEGQRRFGDELARSSPQEQAKYVELYEKTCRRKFDDTSEARAQVASMANYLDRQGKLDDFVAWSREESQRRQKEYEAELARRADEKAQQDRERRDQAIAAAERRRQADQELAMKRLEYSYQLERQTLENDRRRYDDYGYGYGYGPGVYYYGDPYRAALRTRIVTRYNNWNAGRPGGAARPVPGVWTRKR